MFNHGVLKCFQGSFESLSKYTNPVRNFCKHKLALYGLVPYGGAQPTVPLECNESCLWKQFLRSEHGEQEEKEMVKTKKAPPPEGA